MFQCDGCMMRENLIADLRERIADRDAEIERLRVDLVWAVRQGVMVGHDENLRPCVWFDVHRGVEYDGTSDAICRVVRSARTGE